LRSFDDTSQILVRYSLFKKKVSDNSKLSDT